MTSPSSIPSPPAGDVDLQLNGYAGIDFNRDGLTAEELHRCCERLRVDGVAGVLATVITDDPDAMCGRLRRLARLRAADPLAESVIWGMHVEGPFLNPADGYIGAHPAAHARTADVGVMDRLLDAAEGLARMVTLAPEMDPEAAVTRRLADRGILVSAGHCEGDLDTMRRAIDSGLTMFTHLGNGCPKHLHRHDNVVQRILSLAEHLTVTFIADGVHVPLFALANYLRCCRPEGAVVVTDAIAAAGLGPGRYIFGGNAAIVGDDLAPWAEDGSHLMGSAVTMPRSRRNLADALGLSAARVDALVRDNPLRLLGRTGQVAGA